MKVHRIYYAIATVVLLGTAFWLYHEKFVRVG